MASWPTIKLQCQALAFRKGRIRQLTPKGVQRDRRWFGTSGWKLDGFRWRTDNNYKRVGNKCRPSGSLSNELFNETKSSRFLLSGPDMPGDSWMGPRDHISFFGARSPLFSVSSTFQMRICLCKMFRGPCVGESTDSDVLISEK